MTTPLGRRVLTKLHVDAHPSGALPSWRRWAVVTALCVVASLVGAAAVAVVGARLLPSVRGYSHLRLSDYGTLTVIGVVAGCACWPLVIRISSTPRWLFVRLAIVVTVLSFLPDVWLLVRHETRAGVGLLAAMHVVIAVITYNLLVRLAPPRSGPTTPDQAVTTAAAPETPAEELATSSSRHLLRVAQLWGSCAAFVTGLVALFAVPLGRPSGWLSPRGEAWYLVHSVLGLALGVGAVALLSRSPRADRREWAAAVVGAVGVFLAGLGGALCVIHGVRIVGMGLMLLGSPVAVVGYVLPALAEAPVPPPGWRQPSRDGP